MFLIGVFLLGSHVRPIIVAVVLSPFFVLILNNYLGNEQIDAIVLDVNKSTSSVENVSVDFSGKKVGVQPSGEILKPYEVAVSPLGTQNVLILKNDNSLWRAKFNKREIQIQLEPGKKYRFYVHRLFIEKNILKVEKL